MHFYPRDFLGLVLLLALGPQIFASTISTQRGCPALADHMLQDEMGQKRILLNAIGIDPRENSSLLRLPLKTVQKILNGFREGNLSEDQIRTLAQKLRLPLTELPRPVSWKRGAWMVAKGFPNLVLAPIYLSTDALLALSSRAVGSQTHENYFISRVKTDFGFLIGYVAIVVGLDQFTATFLEIPEPEFNKAVEEALPSPPKHVLVLASFDPKEFLYFAVREGFERRFSDHPDATFKRFSTHEDLNKIAKDFEQQNKKFDYIEIAAHGQKGALIFSGFTEENKKDSLSLPDLLINDTRYNITIPEATLVLRACSVFVNGRDEVPVSEAFMQMLGRRFLSQGGQAIASPRSIDLSKSNYESFKDQTATANTTELVYDALGGGIVGRSLDLYLHNRLDRDFSGSLPDIKIMKIFPEN